MQDEAQRGFYNRRIVPASPLRFFLPNPYLFVLLSPKGEGALNPTMERGQMAEKVF
jgi:hypothetical protein